MVSAKSAADGLKVEEIPIGKVLAFPGNARRHPRVQLDQIKASIGQFGFANPILTDTELVVIAGHGRLQAAQEMGLKKVPVIRLSHLTSDQARALRIADNSIAQSSGWDPDMLEAELASLRAVKFDLEPLGLDSIELPDLEDVAATPPPPRANRSKTTIFLSVKNADAEKARKVVAAALTKARIEHNL